MTRVSARLLLTLLCVELVYARHTARAGDASRDTARYVVRMIQVRPPILGVKATLPIQGNALLMETTRPGDIPQILHEGWPALVRKLRVAYSSGHTLKLTGAGTKGWSLMKAQRGRITLDYEVDYSLADSLGWPAPRETAFADSTNFVCVGRSLFIMTPETHATRVTFSTPQPWRAFPPWPTAPNANRTFAVANEKDLAVNLIVFSKANPHEIQAGNFRLTYTPMGQWKTANEEVMEVLRRTVARYVSLMKFSDTAEYSVVLFPLRESGGEAFRNSFALTAEEPPSRANRYEWGHLMAHEIFHYWNGLRLHGDDYARSQWFQEGVTDYVADLALVNTGLASEEEFRTALAHHVGKYENLTTPLDAPGGQKGPPLYSGGALVAFCWDVQIRHATGGKRNIEDVLRELWRSAIGGERGYAWRDILAALNTAAPLQWEEFHQAYISGTQKLPLDDAFRLVGLTLVRDADGSPQLVPDAQASSSTKEEWERLVEGR